MPHRTRYRRARRELRPGVLLARIPNRPESSMTIAIEIIHEHDWDDEHEVGGQDLPVTYTAKVHGGSAADALKLMDADCGTFYNLRAFNLEARSPTEVCFSSFERVRTRRFDWQDSLEREKLKDAIEGKVFHYIKRRAQVALLKAIFPKPTYLRVRWWDRVHPDPKLPPVFDKHGQKVEVGQRCRFEIVFEDRIQSGTGWVRDISSHAIRPIAIAPDDRAQNEFGRGAMPAEIEIIAEEEETTSIEALLKSRVSPRDLQRLIEETLAGLPAADDEYLAPEERQRWATELTALRGQYDSLERLVRQHQTTPLQK